MYRYRGRSRFTREQLVFTAEVILVGALDRVESFLPTSVDSEDQAQIVRALNGDYQLAVDTAGMQLAVLYAQLTDDGLGIGDALTLAGNFPELVDCLVKKSWENGGTAVYAKMLGQYRLEDVLPGYPDTRKLAEQFVDTVFADYLKPPAVA